MGVLCASCAEKVFQDSCPIDRGQIDHFEAVSKEEAKTISELREEEEKEDEYFRSQHKNGESELMVVKFQRAWKKDSNLVPAELLKRIADRHCENQEDPFPSR